MIGKSLSSTQQEGSGGSSGEKNVGPKSAPPWLRRLPNELTWLRIFCIPVVVLLMLQGETYSPDHEFIAQPVDVWAAAVFGLAAVTDFLDGWIARRFGVESLFGKLLDPLADKLLVVSALIILVAQQRLTGWIAVVLIVRDLGINAIRIAALEENIIVSSSWLGKTKTALLDLGIVGLTINGVMLGFIPCRLIGLGFVWAAMAASVISGGQYLWDYAQKAKVSFKNK